MSRIYNKEGKVIDTDEWIEENHPENGVFKIYWAKDGGLSVKDEGLGQRFEWIYKDGKRGNGPSKGWYPNGNRQVPTHGWKDGVYTQVSRIIGENKGKNGHLKQIWNWKNGYKDGVQKYWFENGQLFYEGMFVDGRKEGKWIWWYEDGTKEMEKVHKKGKPDGLWRWWNESGELMKSGTYVNGMKQGMWNYYYDKGQKYFEDIEKQIREGTGHWQWVDRNYGTDEESGKGGERDQNKPFVTTRKKWRPRAKDTS